MVAWKMPTFFNVWRLTVVHSYSKKDAGKWWQPNQKKKRQKFLWDWLWACRLHLLWALRWKALASCLFGSRSYAKRSVHWWWSWSTASHRSWYVCPRTEYIQVAQDPVVWIADDLSYYESNQPYKKKRILFITIVSVYNSHLGRPPLPAGKGSIP